MYRLDLTGRVFGNLTVLSFHGITTYNRSTFLCLCVCGKTKVAVGRELLYGRNVSCGCAHIVNGRSKDKLYKAWTQMKDRCENPKNKSYKYYGARGIKVCDRWNESFSNFKLDMGERPDKHTLERITIEQSKNKRKPVRQNKINSNTKNIKA